VISTARLIYWLSLGLGGAYGDAGDDEGRYKVLDAALAAGCTHWDTQVYAHNDTLLY
jgi:aryl-alcohol dehydrogenase-like predicted oxidoreductase